MNRGTPIIRWVRKTSPYQKIALGGEFETDATETNVTMSSKITLKIKKLVMGSELDEKIIHNSIQHENLAELLDTENVQECNNLELRTRLVETSNTKQGMVDAECQTLLSVQQRSCVNIGINSDKNFQEPLSSDNRSHKDLLDCNLPKADAMEASSYYLNYRSKPGIVKNTKKIYKFKCKLCQKAYLRKGTLFAHYRTHNGVKPYKCSDCEKSFYALTDLKDHRQGNHEVKEYNCSFCEKKFRTRRRRRIHEYNHREKPFQCDICNTGYIKKECFDKHMALHEGNNFQHLCDICGMKCVTGVKLHEHILNFHGKSKKWISPIHTCTTCGTDFKERDFLEHLMTTKHDCVGWPTERVLQVYNDILEKNENGYHIEKRRGIRNRPLPDQGIRLPNKKIGCRICGNETSLTLFFKHLICEHGIGTKPLKCSFCPARFFYNREKRNHEMIHNDERKFECDICGKRFTLQKNLTFHKKKHSGLRPFVCNVCSKAFVFRGELNVHLTLHNKMKLLICMNCDKKTLKPSPENIGVRKWAETQICEHCGGKVRLCRSQVKADKVAADIAKEWVNA